MKMLGFALATTALSMWTAAGRLGAQTLSAEEQEVWDRVTACWSAFADDADVAASLDCFHEDYTFWWAGDVLPFSKDVVRGFHRLFINEFDAALHDLRPARITVRGNVAVVHWGVRWWSESQEVNAERISMTLVREEGVWRYLGGGGSPYEPAGVP